MLVKSQIIQEDGIIIVNLFKKIDLQFHNELTTILQQLLESPDKLFIINLSKVDIISSSSIGAILNCSNQMKKREKKLVLAELSPVCLRVLDLLQLMDSFSIMETNQKAIEYLKKS